MQRKGTATQGSMSSGHTFIGTSVPTRVRALTPINTPESLQVMARSEETVPKDPGAPRRQEVPGGLFPEGGLDGDAVKRDAPEGACDGENPHSGAGEESVSFLIP